MATILSKYLIVPSGDVTQAMKDESPDTICRQNVALTETLLKYNAPAGTAIQAYIDANSLTVYDHAGILPIVRGASWN